MNAERQQAHPGPDELSAFALGRLPPRDSERLEQHVAGCAICCEALRHVQDDTLANLLRVGDTVASTPAGDLANAGDRSASAVPAVWPKVPDELADHPRYRVVGLLGAGGMGVVYKAEHRIMQRSVALKVIRREMMDNPKAVERFQLEVRAAARLSHPNIVTAHDAEQAGDLHFLVMEYVEGTSLARLVEKRGALPIQHACHYVRQAALGLQHAHEQGMVHRDIKPQNLILTRKGQVKILDFGLARFAREHGPVEGFAAPGGGAAVARSITATGSVFGTPDYIAPEQARDARRADIRADIYSLGCTLYHLLAGHVPFPHGSATEKLSSHIDGRAQPAALLRTDLPAELTAILARMMAKDAADRYQTPAEVAKALAPLAKGESLAAADPALSADAGLAVLAAAAALPAAPLPGGASLIPTSASPLGMPTQAGSPLPQLVLPPQLWPLPASRPSISPARKFRRMMARHPLPIVAAAAALAVGVLGLFVWGMERPGTPIGAEEQSAGAGGGGPFATAEPGPSGDGDDHTCIGKPPDTGTVALDARGSASGDAYEQIPSITASSKAVLIVIPSQQYWEPDYTPVRGRLEQAGVRVTVAGPDLDESHPGGNALAGPIRADLVLSAVNPDDWDAVVFVGGSTHEFVTGGSSAPDAQNLLRAMLEKDKYVAAICVGQMPLLAAGVLSGGQAAQSGHIPGEKYQRFGVVSLDQSVVVSGRIITAREPQDAVEFAEAILRALADSS